MNPLTTQARPAWSGTGRGIGDRAPGLDGDSGSRFLRLLLEASLIRRHSELLGWLGQAQEYLPHQIMIVGWGDFQHWSVKFEVLSHLGQRGVPARACPLDDLLRDAYAQWLRGRREPLIGAAAAGLPSRCNCALHCALRGMQPVLIHGVRDKLSGCDSLYVALDARGAPPPLDRSRFIALAHLLLCQLDSIWRRRAAFRLDGPPPTGAIALPRELSAREREILAGMARGSTNHDLAETFAISLFTVKNHVKRIFRKIGVTNRTQAAARFNEALMQSSVLQSASDSGP